jgi:hypothetical protein
MPLYPEKEQKSTDEDLLKFFYLLPRDLARAHRHNLFHFDIKEQNLLYPGPVVCDLGVCVRQPRVILDRVTRMILPQDLQPGNRVASYMVDVRLYGRLLFIKRFGFSLPFPVLRGEQVKDVFAPLLVRFLLFLEIMEVQTACFDGEVTFEEILQFDIWGNLREKFPLVVDEPRDITPFVNVPIIRVKKSSAYGPDKLN